MSGPAPSYSLTELEAFNAMRAFLEAYWQRGLRESDDIAVLLSSLILLPDDDMTADPAQWDDWLAAIRVVKERREMTASEDDSSAMG